MLLVQGIRLRLLTGHCDRTPSSCAAPPLAPPDRSGRGEAAPLECRPPPKYSSPAPFPHHPASLSFQVLTPHLCFIHRKFYKVTAMAWLVLL